MSALFEEGRIIDDPALDRLAGRERIDAVFRGLSPHVAITPGRGVGEVDQSLVCGVGLVGIRASSASDRLHALPLAVAEQTHCVGGKGLPPLPSTKHFTDAIAVTLASSHGL